MFLSPVPPIHVIPIVLGATRDAVGDGIRRAPGVVEGLFAVNAEGGFAAE